ncbi:MAG TPA: glycosyltransferase family 1 protein [Pyrinomonadaceae bacterium]|nr:glycosyltransferase family 1 protein [Pyrinomonadaceae bacterium]
MAAASPESMQIGLDGFPLVSPKTGVGHYTFELATELARLAPEHAFELIAPADFPAEVLKHVSSYPNLRAVRVTTNLITRRWWAVGLPRYVRWAGLDLFHGTNYEVPLRSYRRNVLTVHDLSLFTHPETHDRRIARRSRRRLPIMVRSAARIITPIEAIKREVIDRFKLDSNIVTVTPYAPRKTFRPMPAGQTAEVKQRLGIADDFILSVGTIEPRKNLPTLVRAFAELLRHTEHRPQLIIAGPKGWLTAEFDRAVAEADFGDRLRMIGYVSDEDLRSLYSSCKAFVYPSLYEGFGLPPLEAMVCGAPVIASRIAAHVETLGAHAHLVEPTDERALAQVITTLLENQNERNRMSQSGIEHAAQFSWEKTAKLTLQVYEGLLTKNTDPAVDLSATDR